MSESLYRHRCYCCAGKTMHKSGPCVTCGAVGHLLDPAETLPDSDVEQHRRMVEAGHTCKLTAEEREAAIKFIAAGEPNTWEPEE